MVFAHNAEGVPALLFAGGGSRSATCATLDQVRRVTHFTGITDPMIKVLHLINGEFFAGAERVQDLLALRLPEQDVEVSFVCLKEGTFTDYRRSSVPLVTIPRRSRTLFSVASHIADRTKDAGFRIVHTHTTRSALIGAAVAKKLGVPMVHHMHSPTRRNTESAVRDWINAAMEDHTILPRAAHIIAVSNSIRQYLLEHNVENERISVVPNGVPVVSDTPAWRPPAAEEWIIGTVALFRPRKGIEVLLRSLRELLNLGLNVRLRAVGTFESKGYEQSVKQLCSQLNILDRVEWCGFSSNVQLEMASMHAFVLPSLFGEGMPMVVIEAMSMGLPVVASHVEGIPEVIGKENAGIVVEPNDPTKLTKAIAKLITSKEDALDISAAAHRRHFAHYSDRAMASAVAKVYRNVLKPIQQ